MFVALFGERIAPHEAIYFVVEHGADPRPYDPGLVFPLGSDVLGRDLLSLVLAGARATLTIVLFAGLARVLAGLLVVAVGGLWRPARLLTETLAELVGAVPATLVALILVRAFVKTDTSVLVLIAALLVMGWAGPYRVIRAEVDRLARAPFSEGARAIGMTRSRVFWRHQCPHLVPVIAMNVSQQVVASLVLVAELGVIGVLVGAVRSLDIEESLSVVRTGPPMSALVPDAPEWGAMLASSRTVEALWTTRWVIFVPGAAFALTAVAVAFTGFALARRYARRDVFDDLRGGAAIALAVLALAVVASLVPERYAAAREWSASARAAVTSAPDVASAMRDAGLRTYPAVRSVQTIVRSGPAAVTLGDVTVAEQPPSSVGNAANPVHMLSFVAADTGGGTVEAPLVFAARGIVPASHPPLLAFAQRYQRTPDLGSLIKDYPDDYAGIDVRGKVVLLVRFMGVAAASGYANGPVVHDAIAGAIARGAAGVVFVDPGIAPNAYGALERELPAQRATGVPVVVIDRVAAQSLLGPLGLDVSPFLGYDAPGMTWERSAARDLGVSARIEVPLREETAQVTSVVGEVPDVPADTGRVAIWASRGPEPRDVDPSRVDVIATLARFAVARHAPFVFVDFDPHADAAAVREALRHRRISLVLVLERMDGRVLTFETANGDLIPAFDLYAQKAGARYEVTRRTSRIEATVTPLAGVRTVAISTTREQGDARADAVALIGYLAGRLALGAPELVR